MMATTDDDGKSISKCSSISSSSSSIDENNVIMMFKSSLVQHLASPEVRLPANFVGVRCVRREFSDKNATSVNEGSYNINNDDNDDNNDDDDDVRRETSKYMKFVVVDENGNERRMTKTEKKAKKRKLAKERRDDYQKAKKKKLEEVLIPTITTIEAEKNIQKSEGLEPAKSSSSSSSYHQLPINPITMGQELTDLKGERAGLPTVMLSPPMALQFFSEMNQPEELLAVDTDKNGAGYKRNTYEDEDNDTVIIHSHSLAQIWSNRLKEKTILPAEALRQKEDLRPLAYQLNPEPWQRMRPTFAETPMLTTSRNPDKKRKQKLTKASETDLLSGTTANGQIVNPNPRDWITMTCRPRLSLSSSYLMSPLSSQSQSSSLLQHDDILSIVFEYLHRETNFYVSCGAKFGADYLVYDGPRDKRHAFAGLRVLSRFTNSMTSSSAAATSSSLLSTDKDLTLSSETELPLPTAYSLTSFVRCLNTAGKLALLATVEEVEVIFPNNKNPKGSSENDNDQKTIITRIKNNVTDENNDNRRSKIASTTTTHYRVAFVDVALEKVLDVHKRKRGSSKKKLQKRRDVTQNLAKK